MKKLLAVFLCIALIRALAACGGTQETTSAPAETNAPEAAGNTVTVTRKTSEIRFNGTDTARFEYIYNDQAVCTEIISYMNDEEVLRTTPTCDENGNILSMTYSLYGAAFTDTYTYNEKGQILTYSQLDSEGNLVYGYEDVPHDIAEFVSRTMTILTPNGTMIQQLDNTLDENGYMIRQDVYMDGTLTQYYEITNDENGRLLAQTGYSADGTVINTMEATYDGNTRHSVAKAPDGSVMQELETLFDADGRVLDTKVIAGGNVVNQQSYTYQTFEVPAA